MAEQLVWTSFWTDQAPPTRTVLEQHLTRIAQIAADEGEPGLYRLVVGVPGYQDQCDLWVPERSQQAPQPTPPPSAPTAPDPALMSRCPTLAADLAESLNRDLPPGSAAGGRAFRALLNLCQMAVQQHGSRGFNCFEGAWRRAIRLNRTAKPGSTAAARAAEAEYALCVSAR